jgi:GNAT superfamily N-acetyltransferase
VFGGDHSFIGRHVAAHLHDDPPTVVGVLAVADGVVVSAGRVELTRGTDFASLWGGGTLRAWRRRGVFRALVAHRARLAAEAGLRYLQVDASDDSRPILARLGFEELAVTTPFVRSG